MTALPAVSRLGLSWLPIDEDFDMFPYVPTAFVTCETPFCHANGVYHCC